MSDWIWPADVGSIDGLPTEHGFVLTIDGEPVLLTASPFQQAWTQGAQFRKRLLIGDSVHEIVLSIGPQPENSERS